MLISTSILFALLLILLFILLSLLFLSLLFSFVCITFGLAEEARTFEDKELAAIADIDKLQCFTTETFVHIHELDWSLEMAFEVKYEESTTKVSKDVVLANKRDIIVVVFTTLG